MNIRKVSPISDRVLIELIYNDKSKGGLYLPDNTKDRGNKAKVIRCGPGKVSEHTHKIMPMDVKIDDIILIGKYTGWHLEGEDANLRMIHNADILAIIEREN